jgi:outer membrane receptor protein involved in Fe transport
MGFHSNDARGVTAATDAADPLVRTYGAEVGVRTAYFQGLHSTAAVWWLDSDSELVFVGDAGETTATRPSRRYGIELANYYSPLDWLTFDVDYSWSHTRFRDNEPEGEHVPGSIENVVAAGVTVHDIYGLLASLRLRYFGPRPLNEDDSERSHETIMLGALLAYDITPNLRITGEVFNVLDRNDAEIDYFYDSCLQSEITDSGGVQSCPPTPDIHFHPVYPIMFRGAVTARF